MEKLEKKVLVNLSSEEVALLFCSMDSNEMSRFFHSVYIISSKSDNSFEFKMSDIANIASIRAKKVMKIIGKYADCELPITALEDINQFATANHLDIQDILDEFKLEGASIDEYWFECKKCLPFEKVTIQDIRNALFKVLPF